MMQIKELVLYGRNGQKRYLKFNLGKVNIITGSSGTGKSAIGDIIEYCLGGDKCEIAAGIIRNSVAWYGLLLQFKDEQIFVARENPPITQQSTNKCYYEVGKNLSTPIRGNFMSNTTNDGIEKMISAKLGICENLNIPPLGQTRAPLEANIRHALIYNFQKQTEIASKTILFHRQEEDFMTYAIKDTLPYFLGIVPQNALELENQEKIIKRKLNIAQREIQEVKQIEGNGLQKAIGLLSEAIKVGLVDEDANIDRENYKEVICALNVASQWQPSYIQNTAGMDRLSQLQQNLNDEELRLDQIKQDIKDANDFLGDIKGYTSEIEHQKVRLESIGIFDTLDFRNNRCPLCSSELKQSLPSADAIKMAAKALSHNLETVTRDKPKLRKYVDEMENEMQKIQERIKSIKSEIAGIYEEDSTASKLKDLYCRRAVVIGRISLWLESVKVLNDSSNKEKEIESLERKLIEIENLLGEEQIEEKKQSVLRILSEDMSNWARELKLEHCENPIRLDMDNVTAVIDLPERPVTLQQLGSGKNWVGIHLITYFALHKYFIKNHCPVPNFIFMDQPSQVYFPSEKDEHKHDVEAVKRIYHFIFERVNHLYPDFQVIIVDHANFIDKEFQDAVIEQWSEDGIKLIPDNWSAI